MLAVSYRPISETQWRRSLMGRVWVLGQRFALTAEERQKVSSSRVEAAFGESPDRELRPLAWLACQGYLMVTLLPALLLMATTMLLVGGDDVPLILDVLRTLATLPMAFGFVLLIIWFLRSWAERWGLRKWKKAGRPDWKEPSWWAQPHWSDTVAAAAGTPLMLAFWLVAPWQW